MQLPRFDTDTVYVVATGPSLTDVDLSCLDDRKVIAINLSFRKVKKPSLVYFYDRRFYRWHGDELDSLEVPLVTCAKTANTLNVTKVKTFEEFAKTDDAVVGPDSGSHAVTLAMARGAKRIVLLGYDMKFGKTADGGVQSHWFGDYPIASREHNYSKRCAPFFDKIAEYANSAGVKIINANLDSALEQFEKKPLEDLL